MKKFLSNPRVSSGFLILSGIAILGISLIKHPEDWPNWLTTLGVGLIVLILLFSVLYLIRYIKNRKLNG